MGSDKSTLKISGRSLLSGLLDQLRPLSTRTVIMLSASQSLPPDLSIDPELVTIGRDRRSNQGPLNGIADALPLLPSEIDPIFVLSCDLPYLTTDWLRELQRHLSANIDAVVTRRHDIVNPLIALYHRQVLWQAPKMIAAGRRSCMTLLNGRRIAYAVPSVDSNQTQDVNTPVDFNIAKTYLEAFPRN
jgi:molybdopterin-guanine dinucleotide biosynthesis protein A